MVTWGFTGTRHGMTNKQKAALSNILLVGGTLHLGDCVGADLEAALIGAVANCKLIGHPPSDPSKRGFYLFYDEEREPLPYLVRNRVIVEECEILLAAPHNRVEDYRSGTWYTVRHARKWGKPVVILEP